MGLQVSEIVSGTLACESCKKKYPILRGVAVLAPEVRDYLLMHVKGISRWVSDSEIPAEMRQDFKKMRAQIEVQHIEEDLEAERVTSLYVMNHYLQARGSSGWWRGGLTQSSPEIAEIIERYWDSGPFSKISELWGIKKKSLIEVGCGVGGLYRHLASLEKLNGYLGIDSSFASIALARQLALGLPDPLSREDQVLVPGDLLSGSVSHDVRDLVSRAKPSENFAADFVVGDATDPPVKTGEWDVAAALNMIDMLDDPEVLPKLQRSLIKKDGAVIQSSPYVWHPGAAETVKERTGENDSARAVERLYQLEGFQIDRSLDQVPWLFFKHVRQLEIYSVHLFFASLSIK